MIRGAGTVLNVVTVLLGSGLGLLLGQRLPHRTRDVVTDSLGLVTLLAAALSAAAVLDPALTEAVGSGAVLVVLGSLLVGSIAGSLLRVEQRLEHAGGALQQRFARSRSTLHSSLPDVGAVVTTDGDHESRERFVQGFLTASLVFCVGPLTILGPINDGLGRGIDMLALKATLDGFAAIAFASSFGVGVAVSAVTIAVVQGSLTGLGWALGDVLPAAHIAALTATGGLLLAGIGIRLLRLREVPVGDMLPALAVAPVLTQLVVVLR
ncbi:MAG TPA: DUF554 domain-containing protein [Actinomycetales bacterium]|nr:DUF554 domain-containing protein [Actinomycetales bacterium]